jgi:hypothetical protein
VMGARSVVPDFRLRWRNHQRGRVQAALRDSVPGRRRPPLRNENRRGYLQASLRAERERVRRAAWQWPIRRRRQARTSAVVSSTPRKGGDGLLGWVVAVDDVGSVARRRGTTITTIRRARLSARLTGVAEATREPFLPFLISRDPGVPDPGIDGDAGGITWIEVAGDAARPQRWLDISLLPVRVVDGPPAVQAVGIGERSSGSSGRLLRSRRRLQQCTKRRCARLRGRRAGDSRDTALAA